MKHFARVHDGLDVSQMVAELDAAPDLWDENPERRITPGSPHAGMTDIWLRARAREELTEPDAFKQPHWPVFYPAWNRLPALHGVVWGLMASNQGVQLGNVLITRIPPGGQILPHVDPGWAVNWFDRKFYVTLRGGARCVNVCLDEEVNMRPGEIWRFENRVTHSVENHDKSERISLIITLRSEP